MIPTKDPLSEPQTPWHLSPELSQRLQPIGHRFKATPLLPSDPESAFILRHFMRNKPPGYSMTKITCVYNRSLHLGFIAHLMNIEEEAKKFHPMWQTESLSQERKEVIGNWKNLTTPFSPLKLRLDQEEELLHHAKVLPLWHGTSPEKSQSICESGFTYFGKHPYFSCKKGAGSTDIGYFGSGIYFTESAEYASMYSKDFLLLSWVSMREPYPVVSDKPHPKKCTDMLTLEGKGAYQNYDAHFIPVASIRPNDSSCMIYYPCHQNQPPAWHEVVVFQKAQALPSFIIELGPDLLHSPPVNYTFESCYAACQAGDLPQVKSWIQEEKKRLYEEDAQGETFLFAAVLGNQLPLIKWLLTQDSSLLEKCRKDGWTLMHMAAATGHTEIVSWLHETDPEMIRSGKITPLHIAAFHEQTKVLGLFLEEVKKDTPLIEEIVQRPSPITLLFLLENDLNPNQTNKFKQTLLHLAAYKGQVTNIKILLRKGATLDAQDLSQKTPLYLAVVQGHLSAVILLLGKGANPILKGIEGDTILHVAAFYGYTPLVKVLLKYPLLHLTDEDGKQPIHKAVWGHPKPDIVQLLLEAGADPNALNTFGYAPLHWAAKHGHIASAEILLKAGARPDSANQNHDLPFDLAVRWGQDAFVHFFLGIKPKEPEQLPQDIEGYYCSKLLQAKRDEFHQEQIFYLEKLSDLCMQKQNWVQAAKILNGALAILDKHLDNLPFRTYLLARLERIEALFLESKGLKVPFQHKGTVLNYRTWLKNIRDLYIKEFKEGKPVQEILPFLTASYKKLLGTLILDSQELLGTPPVQWACVGMGSMVRGEMCPYSDLEYAFLIEKKSGKNLQYFRTLAELLELKVINLGETSFPIFGKLFEEATQASPTPSGFSLDSGGNTPMGKPGLYELIDTPKGLAQFQSIKWMEDDIIVTNALSAVCYVAGDERLCVKYRQAKKEQHDITDNFFSFIGTPFRETFAMKLLQGHLQEFKPDLSKGKQETNAFGIKKELYRPFQSLLGSLTLFYGLPLCSSFGMIKQLLQNRILCPEGAKNLTQALSTVLNLRFEAHTFYQHEGEFLLHLEEGRHPDPHYLYLDEKRLTPLHEIYKVLIPFHACAVEFLRTKDSKSLSNSLFYDESPQIQGAAFEKTLQYGQAQEAHQQAVSLNPNDINAQLSLGSIEEKMAEYQEALKRNFKALALAQQKHGENHPNVTTSYNNIGSVYDKLGEYDKALEFYQKALNIRVQILGENPPGDDVAASYNNIGNVYDSLGDYDKALEFYQKALKIWLQVFGENHPNVATSYNNIGLLYDNLEEHDKALEFHQKALKIGLQVLDENHPSVALSYHNIGLVYDNLREYDKALEFYQKALKISLQVLGENHPSVAGSYNNIGAVYKNLREYDKALEFYQKALKILLQVLGENHPYVAISYHNIGNAYDNLGEYGKALEYYQKDLKISLQVLGENHPNVATSYNNIGNAFNNLGEYDKALEFFQKALKIRLQILDENHPDVATSYNNIGNAYDNLGEYGKALEYYQKDLKISLQVLGENHPNVATSYNNIGNAFNNLGEYDKALEFFQKALKIRLQILDENHPDVAQSYNNIGDAFNNLGEYDKALEFFQKALKILLYTYGENHHSIKTTLTILIAWTKKASLTHVKTLTGVCDLCMKILESEHALTQQLAQLINSKISSDNQALQPIKSQQAYRQAVSLNPNVIDAQLQLGPIENKMGNGREALPRNLKVLKLTQQKYGENHPDVATSYNNIGSVYYNHGEYDKALEYHQKALNIRLQFLGENHPDVATSYNNIGRVYHSLGEYDKALEFYPKALKILLLTDKGNRQHVQVPTVLKSLICCAKKASPTQVRTLREVCDLCKEEALHYQLAQLINSKISSDNQALQPVYPRLFIKKSNSFWS